MSTFGLYLIGYVIFLAGCAWGAHRMGVPPVWIVIGTLILLGVGIFTGVSRTKHPDPPA
jgi:hypothetical protein